MNLPIQRTKRPTGVTLVELLLCIGLIAIMTTLAVPMFSTADGTREAKDRRNAQTICSMSHIIQAAGVPLVEEGKEKMDIIQEIRDGITVQTGPYQGKTFRISNLPDDEIQSAASYLQVRNGQLIYSPARVDG
jgi:competence protein ComGC